MDWVLHLLETMPFETMRVRRAARLTENPGGARRRSVPAREALRAPASGRAAVGLWVLFGFWTLASCSAAPKPPLPPARAEPSLAAASAKPEPPPEASGKLVHELPRVPGLSVDASGTDWGTRGLSVEALVTLPPGRFDESNFDAEVRLGWDTSGLELLFDVTDRQHEPAPAGEAIWLGDSVEIFVADTPGADSSLQLVVAGPAGGADGVRQELLAHGAPRTRTGSVSLAYRERPDGYRLEARLPWSLLGSEPRSGTCLALQFYVNDYAPRDRGRKLVFYPAAGTHENTSLTQQLCLTEQGSRTLSLAAATWVRGALGGELFVTTSQEPGRVELESAAGEVLPEPHFSKGRRLWWSKTLVPLALGRDKIAPIQVRSGHERALSAPLYDPHELQAESLAAISLELVPAIFQEAEFPRVELDSPESAELARELLGEFLLETRWYDSAHRPVERPTQAGRYGAVVELRSQNGHELRRELTACYLDAKALAGKAAGYRALLDLPEAAGGAKNRAGSTRGSVDEWLRSLSSSKGPVAAEAARLLAFLQNSPTATVPKRLADRARLADERWWYEQRRAEGISKPYPYLVHVPPAASRAQNRLPLLVFLHGSGERGSDLAKLSRWPPVSVLQAMANRHQFMLLVPQCPPRQRWSLPELEALLTTARQKHEVDAERIYLVGASMGGFATWALAAEHADWFAAAVPICGGGAPDSAGLVRNLPVWAFHGALDEAVPARASTDMVSALRASGGRVRYTLYPDVGHAAWVPALENDALFTWLLEQRRAAPGEPRSRRKGGQPDFER